MRAYNFVVFSMASSMIKKSRNLLEEGHVHMFPKFYE